MLAHKPPNGIGWQRQQLQQYGTKGMWVVRSDALPAKRAYPFSTCHLKFALSIQPRPKSKPVNAVGQH
eukprot:3265358-Amphidinium_carterae.3